MKSAALTEKERTVRKMVKIYGASDDLVEIEGSRFKEDEIGCFEYDVRFRFTDGTQIRIGYPNEGAAIWWIEIEKNGTAEKRLSVCENEDNDPHSDVFEIDAEIKDFRLIGQKYKAAKEQRTEDGKGDMFDDGT